MALITTFVTDTEMSYYYSEWTSHSANTKTEALAASYGLVKSYLAPTLPFPAVAPWDGTTSTIEGVPAILKICQSRFAQYLVQHANLGYTDEAQAMYEATVEMLRGLQESELGIPGTTIFQDQTGWSVTSQSCVSGTVHILSPESYPHSYPMTVEIVIDSASSGLMPYHQTFNPSSYATYKYRFPNISTSYRDTLVRADNQWQTIPDASLAVAFEGRFSPNESFIIRGIPITASNVEEKTTSIKQRYLSR